MSTLVDMSLSLIFVFNNQIEEVLKYLIQSNFCGYVMYVYMIYMSTCAVFLSHADQT